MVGERPQLISNLPKLNRHDGQSKYLTRECPGCSGFLQLSDGKVCTLGVAWKKLSDEKIRNTCELKREELG